MTETSLNTVNFADRIANSAQFKALYAEGMGLVEETAAPAAAPADYSNIEQRKAAVASSTNSQTGGGTFGGELAGGNTVAP